MNVRVVRRGPAGKYEMWGRCRDPERWSSWMAFVREVDAVGPLRPGVEGDVVLAAGVHLGFEVLDVDEAGPSWTPILRLGPFRLTVEHHVDEGFGLVEIRGPFPLVLASVPFVRRSLSRLLRRGGQSPPSV